MLQDATRRLFGPRQAILWLRSAHAKISLTISAVHAANIFHRRDLYVYRELELASRLLYSFTSTAAGQQTPGEEYCDILQAAGDLPNVVNGLLEAGRFSMEFRRYPTAVWSTFRGTRHSEQLNHTIKAEREAADALGKIICIQCSIATFAGSNLEAPGRLRRILLSVLESCGPYVIEEIQVNPGTGLHCPASWKFCNISDL